MIGSDGIIKIADFSHCKEYKPFLINNGGTLRYTAPEVLEKKYINFKIDCWSLGICMYFFITGQFPFIVLNPLKKDDVIKKLKN